MTDLGIEESFSRAAKQMKEHHGLEISPSTVSRVTLKHAKGAQQLLDTSPAATISENATVPVVAEMDGGMVPLVETGSGDRRKGRITFWAELKVGVIQRLRAIRQVLSPIA